jgi:hypothetical protein
MGGQPDSMPETLLVKIARLVEERGWNQECFARIAGLHRHTVRQIFRFDRGRRLRIASVNACAKALGLAVSELRDLPLPLLLSRMKGSRPPADGQVVCRLYDQATQPELLGWIERNPQRARQISPEEMDELLSLQGTGGPLTQIGVEHFVEVIERKRRLMEKVSAVAGTEYIGLLEQLVDLLYQKVQPYSDRV